MMRTIRKDFKMEQFYTKYKISQKSDSVLIHHGIAGQKWGKQNGPPYPLDYNDHSALEKKGKYQFNPDQDHPKKNKPLKNMVGNKKTDKKILKETYAQAKYATAASKRIEREKREAQEKVRELEDKGKSADKINAAKLQAQNLESLDKKAKAEAEKQTKKLVSTGKEFTSLYASNYSKKFSAESLSNMSERKAKRYVNSKGHAFLAGTLLSDVGTGAVASLIQRSRNKSEYEAYKARLSGNKEAEEIANRSAKRKDIAMKGYIAYNALKTHEESRKRYEKQREEWAKRREEERNSSK